MLNFILSLFNIVLYVLLGDNPDIYHAIMTFNVTMISFNIADMALVVTKLKFFKWSQ